MTSPLQGVEGTIQVWDTPNVTWLPTFTGRRINILDPDPDDIQLLDIIQSLGNSVRYFGCTYRPLHTAEHTLRLTHAMSCIYGSKMETKALMREGLMHDAHEAYFGEIPRPIKYSPFMEGYRRYEKNMDRCIRLKYGMLPEMPEEFKMLDRAICHLEMNSGLFTDEFLKERSGLPKDYTMETVEMIRETQRNFKLGDFWGWGAEYCITRFKKEAQLCDLL